MPMAERAALAIQKTAYRVGANDLRKAHAEMTNKRYYAPTDGMCNKLTDCASVQLPSDHLCALPIEKPTTHL